MATETAVFGLRIGADNEPAKEAAEVLEKFRAQIESAQERVAGYRKSLSMLKGDTEEVIAAKKQLKAAIEAEKVGISKANLEILKLGGSYDKLAKAHKKQTDAMAASKKVISSTGGPVKDIVERFEALKGILSGVTSGWGLLAVASVAVVAGLAAITAGAIAMIAKFTEWAVVSGDALRNAQLMRDAAAGNAKDATAWGHQIDWLSMRVASSKDELNKLAVATEKSLRGTRVSGAGMVDTFKAVATAGAAMGDDVGSALNQLLTRGKMSGTFGLSPQELIGTGLKFKTVAEQLAKDLNIGLDQASMALLTHRVRLDAGAKAVREVVEKQFGDINAKKMLSLSSIWTKFQDNVRDWTQDMAGAGGALEPLLKSLKSVVDMFGLQSESGQKMKAAVTGYAASLAAMIDRNLPLMKSMVETGLTIASGLISATGAVIQFATSSTGLFVIKSVLVALAIAAGAAVVAMAPLIATAAVAAAPFVAAGVAIVALVEAVRGAMQIDWGFLGDAIIKGITGGLVRNVGELKSAVTGLAGDIASWFSSKLKIGSPSKVFADFGKFTVQGYARGITSEQDKARDAVGMMVDAPSEGGGGASVATSSTVAPVYNFSFQISGPNAERAVGMLRQESVLGGITHAVQTALRSAGMPTGVAVGAGG